MLRITERSCRGVIERRSNNAQLLLSSNRCVEIEMLRSHHLKSASLAILLGVTSNMSGLGPAFAHELPLQSVIDGRRVQPSEKQLKALGDQDVTGSEAAEVDQLYQMLTHCHDSASGCATSSE
jgi:hypothetical protein